MKFDVQWEYGPDDPATIFDDAAGVRVYWRPIGGSFTTEHRVEVLSPAKVASLDVDVEKGIELEARAFNLAGFESSPSPIILFGLPSAVTNLHITIPVMGTLMT